MLQLNAQTYELHVSAASASGILTDAILFVSVCQSLVVGQFEIMY